MCGMKKLYQDFFRLRGLSPAEPIAGHVQSHSAKEDLMPAAADLSAMISVASYIDDHYSEQIPLDFLCKIACMSKAKLMHDFKATYHISIHQYQPSKRIAHADHLLRDTNLSISEIANLTGYGNQGSFSDFE